MQCGYIKIHGPPSDLGHYTFLHKINTSGVKNRLLLKSREHEKRIWQK